MAFDILRHEKDVAHFNEGEAVFRDGDEGECLYFVVEGSVAIRKGDRTLETVDSGGVFGEMALIDHMPRSADAIATAPTQLARISEKRFLSLVQQTPFFALQLMQVLTGRLRRNTAT